MSGIGRLRDEIARLSQMIGDARQRVATGAAVDLVPIGDGIDALCRTVAMLPDQMGLTLRDDLVALSGRLDRLGADIQARLAASASARAAAEAEASAADAQRAGG